MQNPAAQAYDQEDQTTGDTRDLEAKLLMRAATRLQSVCDNWSNNGPDLDDALRYNQHLWAVFVSSTTHPDNPLPVTIKQNIANLSAFVFSHTTQIQTDPQPDLVPPLISINRELAAGLRGSA